MFYLCRGFPKWKWALISVNFVAGFMFDHIPVCVDFPNAVAFSGIWFWSRVRKLPQDIEVSPLYR